MATGKRKKRKVNPGRLLIAAAVLVVVVMIGGSLVNIVQLHLENARLKEEHQEKESTKEKLATELENVNNLEYIERQAREKLLLIKEGERVYVVEEEPSSGEQEGSN